METIKKRVDEYILKCIEYDIIQTIDAIENDKEKFIYQIKTILYLDKEDKVIHNTIVEYLNEIEPILKEFKR